jgi:hypothetical protein
LPQRGTQPAPRTKGRATSNRRVDGSGTALTADFSAPSAGGPPWHVHRITTTSAVVLGTVEPGGATRFDFGAGPV